MHFFSSEAICHSLRLVAIWAFLLVLLTATPPLAIACPAPVNDCSTEELIEHFVPSVSEIEADAYAVALRTLNETREHLAGELAKVDEQGLLWLLGYFVHLHLSEPDVLRGHIEQMPSGLILEPTPSFLIWTMSLNYESKGEAPDPIQISLRVEAARDQFYAMYRNTTGTDAVHYLNLVVALDSQLATFGSCEAQCRLAALCREGRPLLHGNQLSPGFHAQGLQTNCDPDSRFYWESTRIASFSCSPCEGQPSLADRIQEHAARKMTLAFEVETLANQRDMVLRQYNMLRFFLADIEEEILDLAVLDILEAHPSVVTHYAGKLDERVLTHDGFANFLVTGFAPPRMSNESSRDRKLRRDRALEDLLARRLHEEEWSDEGRRVLADSLVRLAHQQAVLFPESPDAPAAMARAADYLAAYEGEHGRFPHEQTRTEVRAQGSGGESQSE